MKYTERRISLEIIEPGLTINVLLEGLASEKKYQKDVDKFIVKLANKRFGETLSHQPLKISRFHGTYKVTDSQGRKLSGR